MANSEFKASRPSSVRLLDYLTCPIGEPGLRVFRNSRKGQLQQKQQQHGLGQNDPYIVPKDLIQARQWRNFTYPVLRIALKDLLDFRPHDQELYSPAESSTGSANGNALGIAPFLSRIDFPVTALLNRVSRALRATARQSQWSQDLHFELEYLPWYNPDPRQNVSAPDREWHFYMRPGQRHLVVGLITDAADEFPLASLGSDAHNYRVQLTLQRARAACWAKGADYGFVLTPEGAALLRFRESGRLDNGPKVCFAVIPWARRGEDVNRVPLAMALWAVCALAEAEDRRMMREGEMPIPYPPPLNFWVLDEGAGAKTYRHAWLPQKTKGCPPGAVVQRRYAARARGPDAGITQKVEMHDQKKKKPTRRKRGKSVAVDRVFIVGINPEPWSCRLRPRKRRPNYRV
ncbi:hypothetical protein PFICI_06387 [Pestalotiopsis fici W106-1]|uniref:Uncharacterized protein n=1 Tax=Pestalotiopsis fici (strain W106-1 / CGMCC3.15140) TaxID=1229662 RepID=W3X5Q5_PESFW|nr:uncharacterized protein PFICI_06387 [Pestalotiopsis fici W106-1]ETS81385.1 hypothetical protein PFICI_06387 [Pestalotiopsis fici W106-1]